ncbi:hypothetical protein ACLN6N_02555 [Sphingomonas carotinifaciens]|uniref:hypothetical protein n=1 Tax=Sphingomonas carotinifaciens TaxID=1166323 RepID=UPI0039A0DB1C
MTRSTLYSGNVEACVVRIERELAVGWRAAKASVPDRGSVAGEEEDAEEAEAVGVLRAALEGNVIVGRVLAPRLQGPATATINTIRTSRTLGRTSIDAEGRFKVAAPGVEKEAWESGRLVLRIETDGKAAERFVSIAAASELIRRAGPIASRIFAILAGNETPVDVAAILAWFREDPSRILRRQVVAGGSTPTDEEAVRPSYL